MSASRRRASPDYGTTSPPDASQLSLHPWRPGSSQTPESHVVRDEPPRKRTKLGMLWDTFDAPPDERRLLFKLDAVLLTFCSLGYFLKYLDQANISSAFVSGMKEDLNMFGNELTYATTFWTVGYALGQIPSNLILTRVPPRYWIPMLELGWGVCTLASYKVDTVRQLYFIRFFVGLFESGFYPAAQYLLGSFYKPNELGKRAVLFHCMGAVGSMLSSVLAAATYTGLNGARALEGWRWLFIIDGVITLPIAAIGILFLPSLPGQPSFQPTFWLSQPDLTLIQRRMASIGRAPVGRLTLAKLRSYTRNWHVILLPALYVVWNNGGGASGILPLWLKAQLEDGRPKYSVVEINHLAMPVAAVGALGGMVAGWLSDGPLRGRRWPMMVAFTLFNAALCITLLILPVYEHVSLHFWLYYATGLTSGLSGLYFAWANEICSNDNEERALVVVLMNDLAYVVQAIVPNFVWKTVDYPEAMKGLAYSVVLNLSVAPLALLIRHLHKRETRLALAADDGPETEGLLAGDGASTGGKRVEGGPEGFGEPDAGR